VEKGNVIDKILAKTHTSMHRYQSKHYPKIFSYGGDLTKRWYVEYFIYNETTGKYVRKRVSDMNSLHTSEERLARCEKLVKDLKLLLAMGHTIKEDAPPKKETPLPSVVHLFDTFFEEKKERLRSNSLKPILSLRNELASYAGKEVSIKDFDAKTFLRYLRDKEPKTYNSRLASLKEFCTWVQGRVEGYQNPIAGEKLLKVTDMEGAVPFSREQISSIKEYLQKEGDEQLLLFITFVYYTLARPEGEILKMQVKDIKDSYIFIPAANSKTGNARHVAIPKFFEAVITEARLRSYPPHFFIFGDKCAPGPTRIHYRRLYRRHCKMLDELGLGNAGYQLYGYKHTGACELYNATKDLLLVRDQCGHSSAQMTEVYLRGMGAIVNERIIDSFPEF
jgi:integrase